jgi:hypothetical protein
MSSSANACDFQTTDEAPCRSKAFPPTSKPRKATKRLLSDRTPAELEAYYFETHIIPEPNSGCWLWTGGCDRDGYGLMRFGNGGRPTSGSAHRAMWQFRNGPMPNDRYACHSCDTPACVNPDHIWPGTPQENNDDCVAKGRKRNRERYPDHLCTKRAKTSDAEAAALDPAFPIERAASLLRHVYKGRDPAWLASRLAALRDYRASLPSTTEGA